ncbi:CDP-glycerol:poly(glycerophosphate) glycerophosphotransferase [Streptococcus pneumoniae]|uniref:bifunctional glycosyltransferase/CDP-glycerol:glycerophosphate glycerophosphotransferase n=1 Tax=Staphylococcus TaxID=1279 RepID=UPI0005DBC524|nr:MULTISPECIES: bifunctional glycosyltransferase family 2 protein/CDP-glycerol:glycerophosphate glycerophosphotransferase [Staphylococcus]COP65436.1 CDP-glycerol:poly(glycerophosphate) glycerophosphotransferase [Streptococcus pneumoniae]KTW06385.1 teichoic acid biosynthesis protein F [Staphylococcus warneri]KTW25131.1 teichoic acid biosynthesis protein F [Staphylococcus warneri]MBW4821904.1 bifunctional glycosyltransferase family 2 protein/CDP-glycerol:glycerophosphate glycerophosphotransferas
MLYSIVIPYKESNINMLRDCLDSIDDQTFKDFEVIFIHDGRTNLPNEVKKYHFNYKIIEDKISNNPQVYRNLGVSQSQGEYILFMDADDYIHPNTLIYTKRIIDESHDDVIKLNVKKTHYTKNLTFKDNKKSFFASNTSEQIDQFFKKINVDPTIYNDSEFINELFELGLINHNYNTFRQNILLSKINYKFKAHGLLIKNAFLKEHSLQFDTTNTIYGDIPFVISVYNLVDTIKQTTVKLYFKLIHNDSVNFPSQTQIYKDVKSYYKLLAFDKALTFCPNLTLAKKIKEFAAREYLYYVIKNENFTNSYKKVVPIYITLCDILNKPSQKIKLNLRHSYEISAIKKGKFKKAYSRTKKRVTLYNIYKFSNPKNERFRKKTIQQEIFSKLPIRKNVVLYESFLGKNFSDSPKAIFEYLKSQKNDNKKHIWILNNKEVIKDYNMLNDNNVKIIDRFSWKYFYYVTVSKYFVLNMRQPKWLKKKPQQTILSTWHGTPLKRLVFDMDNITSASKSYKQDFYQQSRNWDYLIAANEYSKKIFERAFMYPSTNILTYGYPRNDVLTNHDDIYKAQLKNKLGVPKDKKIILYAPTWRDDEYHSVGKYKFTLQLDLKKMQQKLGDEYIVLLRMHYFISDILEITEFDGFAYDFSKYNDVNDLYIVSDILITDYSSVFFDFANLKRPILFYTYDLDKYKDELRGFYINMEKDLPGPLLFNTNEVINSIKNINTVSSEFKVKYARFYDRFCSLEDGKATQRVVNKVIK